ncbi:uncharacterized protein EMH_0051020 [Eimeria mitis]|uniref:Uncharacterized protein n=1 Tax=Eimeria mitis TaxID=44415 RepID=U6KA24_9EIME|nr:uncharacterized protein EMH_0051020 [Eimeria mitis]CDJ33067.1 hypothetical protein EMH_0051020 [Eimeria mitis]
MYVSSLTYPCTGLRHLYKLLYSEQSSPQATEPKARCSSAAVTERLLERGRQRQARKELLQKQQQLLHQQEQQRRPYRPAEAASTTNGVSRHLQLFELAQYQQQQQRRQQQLRQEQQQQDDLKECTFRPNLVLSHKFPRLVETPSPARRDEAPFSFSEGHYTLRLAPEVFGVSVEVQKGRLVRISIREGEDPRAAVDSFCRSHGLHAEEQEWLSSIILKEMTARNLLTLVDGDGHGEKRPQAVETLQESPGSQQQEVWHREPPKAYKGSPRGATAAGPAAASPTQPRLSDTERRGIKTVGRPVQQSLSGTYTREGDSLGSPLANSGAHKDQSSATAKHGSGEVHKYQHLEYHDIWNVPVAPPAETPPGREKGTPSSPSCGLQPGQQQQQERQAKQKHERKQKLLQQQLQQQKLEQQEKQQPRQLSGPPRVHHEALNAAPMGAAAETPPQQWQQQPEENTGEGEGQKQQQPQGTPGSTENGSLRCLAVFTPEAEKAVLGSPYSRISRSSSRSSRREGPEIPSSERSSGWLSPVATERNP